MVFNFRTYSSSSESVEGDPTPPKSFSLKEIQVATHNFSRNNFLAEDSIYKFYRGRLSDGSLVMVKRPGYVNQWTKERVETEMRVGSTVSRHSNVLCLRGFCRTKKELLLVYPLMINKSLSYNLRERPDRFARPLDWTTRKQIALGAARGLAHLHNQGNIKIIHRDICASTILLNVDFEALIGEFSCALIMHERNMVKGIIDWPAYQQTDHPSVSESYHHYEDVYVDAELSGRCGFIAPESISTKKCTLKIDVYAYGIMLLELITGDSISEILGLLVDEHLLFKELIDLVKPGRLLDPNLQGNYVEEEAERLLQLALLCSDKDPSIRPEMSEVVRMLESQFLQRDTSTRSSWSQSECDSTPKSFSLKEIKVATHDFSRNNFLAEDGTYKFYRGRLADTSLVVVKRPGYVDQWTKERVETEMRVGSTVSRHPNVLCLRGFCRTKKELLLVYPLMINKSLSYNLRERPDRFARPLDWTTRKQIALGTARGLAHLHNRGNIKIIHRDICASTILLNVDFEALIGEFSCALIMHERNMVKGIIEWPAYQQTDHPSVSESYHHYEDVYVDAELSGRCGFIAPESISTEKCTLKIDVYAYGIMLLELITGDSISEILGLLVDEHLLLKELIDLVKPGRLLDPNLQGNYVEEEAEQLLRLALLCSDEDPSIRPEMSEVVRMLESQFLQRDTSTRSIWSQSECDSTPYYSLQGDSTPYYSLPPSASPSPSHLGIAL